MILFFVFLLLLFLYIVTFIQITKIDKESNTFNIPNKPDFAFLVHTFDGYKRYWQGFLHFFGKYYDNNLGVPVYFATEKEDISRFALPPTIIPIQTGSGEWGFRLMEALKQIPEEYVLYMQEDMWLTAPLDDTFLQKALARMQKDGLNHLKLQKECQHKRFPGHPELNDSTWYVASHQPAFWKKSFLISTLKADMSPFRHETTTNIFLHQQPQLMSKCQCNQDFDARVFPYEDVSRQGQLREVGKKMLAQENLVFHADAGEIFYRGY